MEVKVHYNNNIATEPGVYNATATISFDCSYAVIPDVIRTAKLIIEKAVPQSPKITDAVINYLDETITFSSGIEANTKEDFSGTYILSGSTITPGTTIYIRYKETENYNPSMSVPIIIPDRPQAPAAPAIVSKTATFENYLEHDITSAIAIASIYDENFLVAVKKHDIINMPIDDSKTFDFVFDDIIGSYRCKIFMWHSFSDMSALSEYYEKGD